MRRKKARQSEGIRAPCIAKHLRKYVEGALESLTTKRVSDEDIHGARKSLKKARAALRLLRPGIANAQYRSLNATLRDAARPLSQMRDSKVLLDTLHALEARYGEPARSLKLTGFKHALNEERTALTRQFTAAKTGSLAHSRRLLRESLRAIGRLPVDKKDHWTTFGQGLLRVYRKARRAMSQARKQQEPAVFHEWRKQVKYLRYELELLEPLWPSVIGELAGQAHKLSDYLGDEHDLTVLGETVTAKGGVIRDEPSRSALHALIAKRQSELREQALLLGGRLFADKPKAFAQRFANYWRQWREDYRRAA
jgi:CHAD domain-containing protein